MTADVLRSKVVLLVVRSIVGLVFLLFGSLIALAFLGEDVPDLLGQSAALALGSLLTLLANSKGQDTPAGTPADPVAVVPQEQPVPQDSIRVPSAVYDTGGIEPLVSGR